MKYYIGDNIIIEELNKKLESFLENSVKYKITLYDENGIVDELGEDTYKDALSTFNKYKDKYKVELSKWDGNAYTMKKINEEAAMYKSNQPTFKDFYEYVIKNPKCKKCYYEITNPYNLRIPSDTVKHSYKKHNLSFKEWDDALSNLENIQNASISKDKLASSKAPIALIRVLGFKDYGITIQMEREYNQITTLFIDHPNTIDNWIRTGGAGGPASQLQASDTSKGSSVTQSSQPPDNIITYIKNKIKR